jgi:nitroreductase
MIDATETVRAMLQARQIREYAPDPVPDHVVDHLLEVARWTGSASNSQPWHFVVVTDPEQLNRLGELRPTVNWIATAPLGIAITLDAESLSHELPIEIQRTLRAYDEGRVTERLLIAANLLGYAGGVAWYGEKHKAEAKRILGVPAERTARSIVMIGRATSRKDPRANPSPTGRKPLSEIVSYDHWGAGRSSHAR